MLQQWFLDQWSPGRGGTIPPGRKDYAAYGNMDDPGVLVGRGRRSEFISLCSCHVKPDYSSPMDQVSNSLQLSGSTCNSTDEDLDPCDDQNSEGIGGWP